MVLFLFWVLMCVCIACHSRIFCCFWRVCKESFCFEMQHDVWFLCLCFFCCVVWREIRISSAAGSVVKFAWLLFDNSLLQYIMEDGGTVVDAFWETMDHFFGADAFELVYSSLSTLRSHAGIEFVFGTLAKYIRAVKCRVIADVFCLETLCNLRDTKAILNVDRYWTHPLYDPENGVVLVGDPASSHQITMDVRFGNLYEHVAGHVPSELINLVVPVPQVLTPQQPHQHNQAQQTEHDPVQQRRNLSSLQNNLQTRLATADRSIAITATVDEDAFRCLIKASDLGKCKHVIVLEPKAPHTARCHRTKLKTLVNNQWVPATKLNHRRLGYFVTEAGYTVHIDEIVDGDPWDLWRTMQLAYLDVRHELGFEFDHFLTPLDSIGTQIPITPELGAVLFPAYFRRAQSKVLLNAAGEKYYTRTRSWEKFCEQCFGVYAGLRTEELQRDIAVELKFDVLETDGTVVDDGDSLAVLHRADHLKANYRADGSCYLYYLLGGLEAADCQADYAGRDQLLLAVNCYNPGINGIIGADKFPFSSCTDAVSSLPARSALLTKSAEKTMTSFKQTLARYENNMRLRGITQRLGRIRMEVRVKGRWRGHSKCGAKNYV